MLRSRRAAVRDEPAGGHDRKGHDMRHLGMLILGIAVATLTLVTAPAANAAGPLQHEKTIFEESFL
jgi:hypothetical protein